MRLFKMLMALSVVSMVSTGAFAQYRDRDRERDRDDHVLVDGELEFKIGDTTIIIGSDKRYDGRDRDLNERVRRLERAVQFLMYNEGFHNGRKKDRWECSLETSFHGSFYAKGQTEAEARHTILSECMRKTNNQRIWCDSDDVECEEIL